MHVGGGRIGYALSNSLMVLVHTSVNTQEAVDQERQGTTATGLGHTPAVREAFCIVVYSECVSPS